MSPNTLRSWESRFGYPTPGRTDGGHRQFELAEIEALRQAFVETGDISSAISVARERGEGPSTPARLRSAFAAFSEEHGFVGAFFILLLYFLILMRLIQDAQTAADLPGSLIIMGFVAVLTFQIAVNVGMVIGLMPVTGIPLPLMSYGGSSVLFTFLALGVAMNVRMRRFVN